MKKAFEEYLIKNGYRQVTGSGNPGTVYDDCRRVDRVAKKENLTWGELAEKIDDMLPCHDEGVSRRREENPMGPSSTP
ncbi:hypothetical protein [uncultured Mailhella sp.]|uniref:hypothetical protein n=1 Tax=uncultured Mailhella sp. TaxID=1981031 RepID=UPI0025E41611|nr:hypothetical protein [uncultured Mailhella sp.]